MKAGRDVSYLPVEACTANENTSVETKPNMQQAIYATSRPAVAPAEHGLLPIRSHIVVT